MVELHFRIIVFPRNSISSQKKQTSDKQKSSRFLDSVWMCPRSDAEKAWVPPLWQRPCGLCRGMCGPTRTPLHHQSWVGACPGNIFLPPRPTCRTRSLLAREPRYRGTVENISWPPKYEKCMQSH